VDLQRNKTSLHIVTSVGYSIEYYDARNNKYQAQTRYEGYGAPTTPFPVFQLNPSSSLYWRRSPDCRVFQAARNSRSKTGYIFCIPLLV